MNKYYAVIDGASRGNPGKAAIGVLIYDEKKQIVKKVYRYLGEYTNNIAEYNALITCLEEVRNLGGGKVVIYSDSELIVKQFNGEYRIKNDQLKKLFITANKLAQESKIHVSLSHVPRSKTKEADRLANRALDLEDFQ